MASIKVTIEMPVAVYQEDSFYVAKCPLGVTSQGESKLEARENLMEAIQLFLESCIEQRILDQVMKQNGFSVENGYESSEDDAAYPDGHLNVPISLIAAGMTSGSQTTYS